MHDKFSPVIIIQPATSPKPKIKKMVPVVEPVVDAEELL
jgi:hypothetical protein